MTHLLRTLAAAGVVLPTGCLKSLLAAYQREAEDAVADSYGVAMINGLGYDRHQEEIEVQTFAAALRASIEEFQADPWGRRSCRTGRASGPASTTQDRCSWPRSKGDGIAAGLACAGTCWWSPTSTAACSTRTPTRTPPHDPRWPSSRQAQLPLVLCSGKTRAEMEPLAVALGVRTPSSWRTAARSSSGRLVSRATPREGDTRILARGAAAALIAACSSWPGRPGAGPASPSFGRGGGRPDRAVGPGRRRSPCARVRRALPGRGRRGPRWRALVAAARAARAAGHPRGPLPPPDGRQRQGPGRAHAAGPLAGRRSGGLGLGDAETDLPLLRAVDRPMVVPRADGSLDPALAERAPAGGARARAGPAGWNAAVLSILEGAPCRAWAPRRRGAA